MARLVGADRLPSNRRSHARFLSSDQFMKRRTAKPFTVEVRKGGVRKRDATEIPAARAEDATPSFSPGEMPGRDLRFRDAEKLFRGIEVETPPVPASAPLPALFARPAETSKADDAPSRRILPDLVAEAALTEASLAAMPQPRRRGRPPKNEVDAAPHSPGKRGRPRRVPLPAQQPSFFFDDAEEPALVVPPIPAVRNLAASERRRARRDTAHLPRAERWKRRLPKVCW